jgi:Galactose oxidase-like, Early set domain
MPWTDKIDSQRIAIHAALVPTSNGPAIVYFDGVFGTEGTRIFDVVSHEVSTIAPAPDFHIMCSGHAFLGDGRWVVAGGVVDQNIVHEGPVHDSGVREAHLYLPLAGGWNPADQPTASLNFQPDSEDKGGGRWYPTLLTVGNGEVLAVAGHPFIGICLEYENNVCVSADTTGADDYIFPGDSTNRHNNNTPERYSPTRNKWFLLTAESSSHDNLDIDEYPRLHLAPSGHVFFSTIAKDNKRFYDPYTGHYSGPDISLGDSAYRQGSKATSVLLPILPNDQRNVWVLVCGAETPHRINIAADDPTWEDTGDRTIEGNPVRSDVCAVILPTGKIFVTGGVGDNGDVENTAVFLPEIYVPAINWTTGQYTSGAGKWETVPDSEADTIPRGYHSVALLMPDGRVWTAGSTNNEDAQEQTTIELYEPDYMSVSNRIVIETCPPSIGYGQSFTIRVNHGPVRNVALIRCGSVTHAFDSDQRFVGLVITNFAEVVSGTETLLELTLSSPVGPGIAPPGYYMLWAIDNAGNPCQQAAFIRICDQLCLPVNNHSTYSVLEAEAVLDKGKAIFPGAMYVFFECFLPGEIGYPSQKPTITLRWDSASGETIPANRFEFVLSDNWAEDNSLPPDSAQRFTFVYDAVFHQLKAFDDVNVSRDVHVRINLDHHVCTTTVRLTTTPNPFMTDVEGGNEQWLSTDLRVFQTKRGPTPFGVTFQDGDTPLEFLDKLLDHFTGAPNDNAHPFKAIPTGFESNPLEWSLTSGGDLVFNFAVAKVRYFANSVDAENVRVFFRLFNTVGTMLDFNTSTTYRRSGTGSNATPLLGRIGPAIISIPFFGASRVTPSQAMTTQTDGVNRRTIEAKGATESVQYFGCWLDINRLEKHIPPLPVSDGPYEGNTILDPFNTPVSIQELLRNPHQCLVAEVHFQDDPIPDAAKGESPGTPANNDNLAQRNLVLVKSGNPGSVASRTVQTTLLVKPSRGKSQELVPMRVMPQVTQVLHANRVRVAGPDELLIRSKNLPKRSVCTLYMPDVDADEVLTLAARRFSPARIDRVDDHTICFSIHNLTFVPLPGSRTRPIPGLMSVELPEGVKKGQVFTITAQQYSAVHRRITGSFQWTIPVEAEADLLDEEIRKLAVMRHIFKAIPKQDVWYPIWLRFVGQVEDRVRAFGGDPDSVQPSPSGGETPTAPAPDGAGKVEGKVSRILYDCFGDFEGFVVETCSGEHVFKECDRHIEQVVWRACQARSRVTIVFASGHRRRIQNIIVHCC